MVVTCILQTDTMDVSCCTGELQKMLPFSLAATWLAVACHLHGHETCLFDAELLVSVRVAASLRSLSLKPYFTLLATVEAEAKKGL